MFDATFQLPLSLGLFQDGDIFHAPSAGELMRIIFRWLHFVAGITWIGMLYFFNLVNVNFMKALDAPTKKIVVPELMPRALWYFRWGALLTVFAGISYYAMYILSPDVKNQRAAGQLRRRWRARDGSRDDSLLRGPNDAPDVEQHEDAKSAADADGERLIAREALLAATYGSHQLVIQTPHNQPSHQHA